MFKLAIPRPVSQEISVPGKNVAATKFPGIYGRSSITERPYFLGSPLKLGAWERALAAHPDAEYTQYLLRGIREGFRIGYDRRSPLRSAVANMPSASERAYPGRCHFR